MNPLIIQNTPEINISSLVYDLYNAVTGELQTGVFGLNPIDDIALWQRARDREQANAQMEIEEIQRDYAMTGFLPLAAILAKALEGAYEKSAQKISSVNRDIALKKSELSYLGRKFNIEHGIAIEEIAIKATQLFVEEDRIDASILIAGIEAEARHQVVLIEANAREEAAVIESDSRKEAADLAVRTWHINQSVSDHVSENISYSITDSDHEGMTYQLHLGIRLVHEVITYY
jgi:hypothetical protein